MARTRVLASGTQSTDWNLPYPGTQDGRNRAKNGLYTGFGIEIAVANNRIAKAKNSGSTYPPAPPPPNDWTIDPPVSNVIWSPVMFYSVGGGALFNNDFSWNCKAAAPFSYKTTGDTISITQSQSSQWSGGSPGHGGGSYQTTSSTTGQYGTRQLLMCTSPGRAVDCWAALILTGHPSEDWRLSLYGYYNGVWYEDSRSADSSSTLTQSVHVGVLTANGNGQYTLPTADSVIASGRSAWLLNDIFVNNTKHY